jgi:hypothetical protein
MPAPQRLSTVLRRLNEIPHINQGGCGISALAIYRWCKAHRVKVNERPFVIITSDIEEVNHNNPLIQNGEINNNLAYLHIVIDIGGKLHDSTGDEDEDNQGNFRSWYLRCEPINEQQLIELINESSWNPWFDRDPYVRVIENRLGIDLSDVDCS